MIHQNERILSLVVSKTNPSSSSSSKRSNGIQQTYHRQQQQNQHFTHFSSINNDSNDTNNFSSSNSRNDDTNSNNDDTDDAISKLIGKRNQIKRQSASAGTLTSSSPRSELIKEIEQRLATSSEPIIDLDLDQLPEFQTKRIPKQERQSSSSSDSDEKDNSKKDTTSFNPIIDYMADYDDENEWHIPNRIIISSIAWGDVNRNFVVSSSSSSSSSNNNNKSKRTSSSSTTSSSSSTSKLSKRLQKMGKFVAGDVQVAIQKCISNGIIGIETSSYYGNALRGQKCSAHDILRECITDCIDIGLPEPIIIESLQRRDITTLRSLLIRPSTSIVSNLETTLGRLGVSNNGAIDMFIVPKYWGVPIQFITKALVAQIESGQTNYVGVSGITKVSTIQGLQKQLQDNDCTLSTNVFPFSLTNQKYFYMIKVCKDLGIVPLISDPLDNGLASGIYTAMNPSGGFVTSNGSNNKSQNKFTFQQLEKLQPLHSVQETLCDRVRTRLIRNMRTIQDKYSSSSYGGKPLRDINTDITTTQIALNYIIAKGGVPMVEVNNVIQADTVLGCLGWTLTSEEVDMLDAAIALCRL